MNVELNAIVHNYRNGRLSHCAAAALILRKAIDVLRAYEPTFDLAERLARIAASQILVPSRHVLHRFRTFSRMHVRQSDIRTVQFGTDLWLSQR